MTVKFIATGATEPIIRKRIAGGAFSTVILNDDGAVMVETILFDAPERATHPGLNLERRTVISIRDIIRQHIEAIEANIAAIEED